MKNGLKYVKVKEQGRKIKWRKSRREIRNYEKGK